MDRATADIVIFGGGIAGLWLLNRLRQAGFSVLLFESGALGGGQTVRSQGIIHGGMKYALQGIFNKEAHVLAELPARWRSCLNGEGEIDLSSVPILSDQQFLWSPQKLTAKLTGFLAQASLNSKVSSLPKEKYPSIFQHPLFKGEVFSLDEMVIDVPVLIRELVKPNQDAVFKIEPICDEGLRFNDEGDLVGVTVYLKGKAIDISAQQFIFTAGAGNEIIVKKLNHAELTMQRRPLHMVAMKTPFTYSLYAHCLGLGNRPRITITTHPMQDGHTVWYLGGALAEEGVELDSDSQIYAARQELNALFPWIDFTFAEFTTFCIDRAEHEQQDKLKPDSFYTKTINNMTIAWPTKLALTPKLADDIMQQFKKEGLTPQQFDLRELRAWPIPPLAQPVWEEVFCKNVA